MAISSATWMQIGTGVVGAIIVGLQGINLNETGAVAQNGEKRATMLEEILDISKNIETGLKNQTQILQNEVQMMQADDRSLKMQGEILETIKSAISARQELLEHQLQEMREVRDKENAKPSPSP
jgi:hypothetical protein